MMRFVSCSSILLLSLLLLKTTTIVLVDAFSAGAGSCTAGNAAVDGTHLTTTPVQTGTLESAGLVVTFNGTPISQVTSLVTGLIYNIAIQPSGAATYKGALVRVEFPSFSSFTLTPLTNSKLESTCTSPARGLTHTNANNKGEFSGILRVTDPGTITLDVTVVISNNANQGSNYRYTRYQIDVIGGSVNIPPSGGGGGGGGDDSDDSDDSDDQGDDEDSFDDSFDGGDFIIAIIQAGGCFSVTNTVNVLGKGHITMDQLQIGDYVQTSNDDNNSYCKVYSFGHKDDTAEGTFMQIYSSNNNSGTSINDGKEVVDNNIPLEITQDHMIILHNKLPIMAKDVQVGDKLMNGKVVTYIEKHVQRRGMYAPVTEAGTLLVSGNVVSSYVALDNDLPAFVQHYGTHAIMAPLRILCNNMNYLFHKYCMNETYTNGISNHILWIVKYITKLNYEQQIWFKFIMFAIATPIITTVYLVEQLLLMVNQQLYLLVLALLTVVGMVFFRKSSNNNIKK